MDGELCTVGGGVMRLEIILFLLLPLVALCQAPPTDSFYSNPDYDLLLGWSPIAGNSKDYSSYNRTMSMSVTNADSPTWYSHGTVASYYWSADATDQYLISSWSAIPKTNAITILLWFNKTVITGNHSLLASRSSPVGPTWAIHMYILGNPQYSVIAELDVDDTYTGTYAPGTVLTADSTSLAVLTYDTAVIRVYQYSGATPDLAITDNNTAGYLWGFGSSAMFIGGNDEGTWTFNNLHVFEARIYNRVLSELEIANEWE